MRQARHFPPEVRTAHFVVDGHAHASETARSWLRRPGAAKSKSSRATAMPPRNTTFSRHTSLWHTTGPRWSGSAISALQASPRSRVKSLDASCNARISFAIDASAPSDCAQSGYGGIGTSPGMNRRRSRPSSNDLGSGAIATPLLPRCRRRRWIVPLFDGAGRNTSSPMRTTSPAFATPPRSTSTPSATARDARSGAFTRCAS